MFFFFGIICYLFVKIKLNKVMSYLKIVRIILKIIHTKLELNKKLKRRM